MAQSVGSSSADDYLNSQVETERLQVLHAIKGKHVRIPDMRQLFPNWPGTYEDDGGANRHLDAVRAELNQNLESAFGADQSKLSSLKAVDFALFAALSWPQAPCEQLCVLAFFSAWLFNWSDEVEHLAGDSPSNAASAAYFRETGTRYITSQLGLDHSPSGHELQHCGTVVTAFGPVGSALRDGCSAEQCARFLAEWQSYANAASVEQSRRLADQVPGFDEYWRCRADTSAVRVQLALAQFAGGLSLPGGVFDSLDMKDVWSAVANIVAATSDLLALKGQVRRGGIENFVPLHSDTHGVPLNESVLAAVGLVRESKNRFEAAANALIADFEWSTAIQEQLRRFLETCQSICVGNLLWR